MQSFEKQKSRMHIYPFDFGSPEFHLSYDLRDLVLRKPLNLEFTPEQIEQEYESIHIGSFTEEGSIKGTLILLPIDTDTIKMRQVAVHPSYQSQNIGSMMVQFSEAFAHQKGYKKMILHARNSAMKFYERLDYSIEGKEFKEVNIPHHKMVKNI